MPALINVQVVTSQGAETSFRVKRQTKLLKLMAAYGNMTGKDYRSLRRVQTHRRRHTMTDRTSRFLYEGRRVNDSDTADSLEMDEDNDTIEVMIERKASSSAPPASAHSTTQKLGDLTESTAIPRDQFARHDVDPFDADHMRSRRKYVLRD